MDRETLYEIVPKLQKEGLKQVKIARILGITQARVSQILKRPMGHLPKWGGHLKGKLSPIEKRQLIGYLELGPRALGFEGDIWNSKRVKTLIKEKFNVDYHQDYMPDLLRKLGFGRQRPKVVDYRKDGQKVQEYLENTLPSLKKSGVGR
jgi:transposase